MSSSGQKFVGRNRAPRVQIEYDVELYGAEKKVELPFVMGVMADLKGAYAEGESPTRLDERKFLDIDAENFSDRMERLKPRAQFRVKNTLSDDGGELPVDITFQSMDDFSPAAVAEKVPALKELLRARKRLNDLIAYMDGKIDAEEKLKEILGKPGWQSELREMAIKADEEDAAVEGGGQK